MGHPRTVAAEHPRTVAAPALDTAACAAVAASVAVVYRSMVPAVVVVAGHTSWVGMASASPYLARGSRGMDAAIAAAAS